MDKTVKFEELRERMYRRAIKGFLAPVLRLAGDNYFLRAVDSSGKELTAFVNQGQYEELRGIKLQARTA